MNSRLKELAIEANLIASEPNGFDPTRLSISQQKFAELIIDECCVKLLDMDGKANGNHNYYKHAAIELKRHFKE